MKYCYVIVFLMATCKQKSATENNFSLKPITSEKPKPDYDQAKIIIDSLKKDLAKLYHSVNDLNKKDILLKSADLITSIIGEVLYSYWKGTRWDFNGITTQPGEGTIACGYFVTTILLDAGYKLNRIKLSICPSMVMMKSLTSSKQISNLSSLNKNEFNTWVKKQGRGVYIVGLDFHTGFILSDGNEVWFMHSNYINRKGVIKELASESDALQASKTKFITGITNDSAFLRRWLFN